jgi:acetate kinase
MNVLALNCGSSSIKFQVFASEGSAEPRRLGRGAIERIGDAATLAFEADGQPAVRATERVADHAAGVRRVLDWTTPAVGRVDAVGHRVVHGGARFTAPATIDDAVIAEIEALERLAPLHNAPALAGIRAARAHLDTVPMVAVFDTAFHATLPERAARYAIAWELAERHGIRRYGFHGTSYRSVLARYVKLTGVAAERTRLVALHLGNGASVAAIDGGRSIDTSMGLTPLEGLVMGTRSGDLDPAIVPHLARAEEVTAETVGRWLNERSGLLGLSGRSADVRDLLAAEPTDARARLALDVFCYRARKYVGAYLAALGGADAVIFTGGIGEHAPEIRQRVCEGLEWTGLAIDRARNAAARGVEARISRDVGALAVWTIPTDEERVIAADTVACLAGRVEVTP